MEVQKKRREDSHRPPGRAGCPPRNHRARETRSWPPAGPLRTMYGEGWRFKQVSILPVPCLSRYTRIMPQAHAQYCSSPFRTVAAQNAEVSKQLEEHERQQKLFQQVRCHYARLPTAACAHEPSLIVLPRCLASDLRNTIGHWKLVWRLGVGWCALCMCTPVPATRGNGTPQQVHDRRAIPAPSCFDARPAGHLRLALPHCPARRPTYCLRDTSRDTA